MRDAGCGITFLLPCVFSETFWGVFFLSCGGKGLREFINAEKYSSYCIQCINGETEKFNVLTHSVAKTRFSK